MTQKMTQEQYREFQQNLPGTKHVSHANLGKNFETMLSKTHAEYAARKLAQIDQNPLQWVYINESQFRTFADSTYEIVAKTNRGNFLKKAKSNIDFSGVIAPHGKAVHFDAKQTKGKSFPLSNLQKHQLDTLIGKEQLGAVAGIMLYFSELNRVFFVRAKILDAAFIEMLYKGGRRSLSLAQCEENAVEIDVKGYFVDWLRKIG